MARISKNDLVKLKDVPTWHNGVSYSWDFGIVIRGPYEDSVLITNLNSNPVSVLSIVCDVMADGEIVKAIPVEMLTRSQKPRDVSP